MEIPEKKKVGRPATDKSTPAVREFWRRRYYAKKAKKAALEASESITPQVEDGEKF